MQAVTRPSESPRARPQIRAVSFTSATMRSGRAAVLRIDCTGVEPDEIRCEAARPGFSVETTPRRVRDGRHILVSLRIHRTPQAPKALCLVRVSAGSTSALASITVLH